MKIAVLLSGGVDSAVALSLLKEAGHDVHAFYLKIWMEEELKYLSNCPWQEDTEYVEKICSQMSVPLEILPMQREYFDTIVRYTISEIKEGRTPNPDMLCNNHIKFGTFLDKIDKSFEKVASGHYAQVKEENGIYRLIKSPDPIKDQTYFLAYLKQNQLSRILFPIGGLRKEEVRKLANDFDLPNKDRKDSQGICFLGNIKFREFVSHYLGEKEGDLIEFETGKKMGTHKGFWYYTIGQRRDIRLHGGPWFIVKKDTEKNIIYISKNYYEEDKKRDSFEISAPNWFAGIPPEKSNLSVKIRHGEKEYPCLLTKKSPDTFSVKIDGDDQGIAKGQFAVFYDGEICLGSGIITA